MHPKRLSLPLLFPRTAALGPRRTGGVGQGAGLSERWMDDCDSERVLRLGLPPPTAAGKPKSSASEPRESGSSLLPAGDAIARVWLRRNRFRLRLITYVLSCPVW